MSVKAILVDRKTISDGANIDLSNLSEVGELKLTGGIYVGSNEPTQETYGENLPEVWINPEGEVFDIMVNGVAADDSGNIVLNRQVNIELTTDWLGDTSPYYQVVAIDGITANTQVDLKLTGSQMTQLLEDEITSIQAINENGNIKIEVLGNKPTIAMAIQGIAMEVVI